MPVRVLTVCTGNVCRSAMARVILEHALKEANIPAHVDSAGISDEEHGNPMDPRAQKVLNEHGYHALEHAARRVKPSDLETNDLVLAMTVGHYRSLLQLAAASGIDDTSNIYMYRSFESEPPNANREPDERNGQNTQFSTSQDARRGLGKQNTEPSAKLDIADPWYGDLTDFEETYEILTKGAPHIVNYLATIQNKS